MLRTMLGELYTIHAIKRRVKEWAAARRAGRAVSATTAILNKLGREMPVAVKTLKIKTPISIAPLSSQTVIGGLKSSLEELPLNNPNFEELLSAIFKYSPDVIWAKDTDGIYLACSESAAVLLGKDAKYIIGKSDALLFPPPTAARNRETDRIVISAGSCLSEEQQFANSETGAVFILEMMKSPIFNSEGKITGVLGVARDITKRKQQEEKTLEQEKLLQQMSELAQVGGWEIDVAAATFSYTAELARIHELNLENPLNWEQCMRHFNEADRHRIEQAMVRTLDTGAACDLESEIELPSGDKKWVRTHWRATTADKKVTRIWGMLQDVTERRKLDESIRMADLIYRSTSEAIFVTDRENIIVDANPASLRLLSYTLEEVIGRTPRDFVAYPTEVLAFEALAKTLAKNGRWSGNMRCRSKEGHLVDVNVDISILRDVDSDLFRRVIHLVDLTEQTRKDEQIWRRTNFDTLTGLPNRALFLDRLEQELKKADDAERSVGVMCIDLDRFRQINSVVGNAEGDRILVETVGRISECTSNSGTLGRLGGDRFVLFLVDGGVRTHLELMAKILIEIIASSIPISAAPNIAYDHLFITASIGITNFPDDSRHGEGLIKAAENAMDVAKRLGGNRFQYFSLPLQQAATERLMLAHDLRYALSNGQLHAYYQPIVSASDARISKAEVLLRWHHPVHGIVSPVTFIPLAEETGLIVEIGEWVLNGAVAMSKHWKETFGRIIELSVNVSAVQFERGSNSEWIERLNVSQLPANCIAVEITESSLVEDPDQVKQCLAILQRHRLRVSLDDFGTGFSSLSYLKNFPVDYLKIDKSFINDLNNDSANRALTNAIINMAHQLGIETIAEGVETPEQRDVLVMLGCDYLQGYLYSRPVPKDAFEELLRKMM